MRTNDPSAPAPADPIADAEPAVQPALNRAARRGKAEKAVLASHGREPSPHARGAQGRRINPVRRTGS
jgi:hypothetical protein